MVIGPAQVLIYDLCMDAVCFLIALVADWKRICTQHAQFHVFLTPQKHHIWSEVVFHQF
jgi:hypothetical protein